MKQLHEVIPNNILMCYLQGMSDLGYFLTVLGHTVERHIYQLPINLQTPELKEIRNILDDSFIYYTHLLVAFYHREKEHHRVEGFLKEFDSHIVFITKLINYIKNTNYIITLYKIQNMLMVDGLHDDEDISSCRIFQMLDTDCFYGNIDYAHKRISQIISNSEKVTVDTEIINILKRIMKLVNYIHVTILEIKRTPITPLT